MKRLVNVCLIGFPTLFLISSCGTSATSTGSLSDVSQRTVTTTGKASQGIDINPTTGYAYVAHNGSVISGCTASSSTGVASTMSIIDMAAGTELTRVNVGGTGGAPIWPLVDSARSVVYISNSGAGTVTSHNLTTGALISTFTTGGKPHAFGLASGGNILLVSNTYDTTQTYYASINLTTSVITHSSAPAAPHGIAVDSTTGVGYMVGVQTGDIVQINMSTGAATATWASGATSGKNTNMMVRDPKTGYLFIAESLFTSSIIVVDPVTRTTKGRITFDDGTGQSPPSWGMAVDSTSRILYAALPNSNAIGVVDLDKLTSPGIIPVGTCPYAVALDTTHNLGASANQAGTVTIFDHSKVKTVLGK